MFVVYNPTCYEEELQEKVSKQLTLREVEYLEKIRLMDMTMYGEVLRELYRYKPGLQTIKRFNESATSDSISLMPSAPCGENPRILAGVWAQLIEWMNKD